jgi:hypothetical protein
LWSRTVYKCALKLKLPRNELVNISLVVTLRLYLKVPASSLLSWENFWVVLHHFLFFIIFQFTTRLSSELPFLLWITSLFSYHCSLPKDVLTCKSLVYF